MNAPLTAPIVRSMLHYDPITGLFKWKVAPSRKFKPGESAGGLKPHGYIKIMVAGQRHYAHRLAWLIVTGSWPQGRIDHKNGNRADNAFANLRDATHQQNCVNRPSRGVRFQAGKWTAQVGHNYRSVHMGSFDTEAEARTAYLNGAAALHGQEWIGRKVSAHGQTD